MIVKLPPQLARAVEQAGDQPLPIENPHTKRVYMLVDVEQYDVVRRSDESEPAGAGNWTESKNKRRCELIHKKFTQGVSDEEARELEQLQEELSAYRKRVAPLPYDVVEHCKRR